MAVSKALIDRLAPELAALPGSTMQPWIEDAEAEVERSVFASEAVADRAVAYYAAHLMAMSEPAVKGAGRVVASVTVGPVSRTFAVPAAVQGSASVDELAQTRFGQRYLALVAPVGVAMLL